VDSNLKGLCGRFAGEEGLWDLGGRIRRGVGGTWEGEWTWGGQKGGHMERAEVRALLKKGGEWRQAVTGTLVTVAT